MNPYHITSVANGVIGLIETGQFIYRITANAMDVIEQNSEMSGVDKKTWVMAFIKSVVMDLGKNWAEYSKQISYFIDQIKTAYNAVKGLIA